MRAWLMMLGLLLAGPAWAQEEFTAARVHLGASGVSCTLHAASGTPAGGLGAVCDVYHRTDSPYTVYVKTGASTWTAVVQMPSSAAAGDLIAASTATVSARIAAVATGQVLASAGTGTLPAYTASPSLTSIGGAANLTINPTGDVVFNPTGNDLLPQTNYDLNIGSLAIKYLTLHAAELWVETLVAQNTIATIGGRILVGPTTTLTSDLGSGATAIVVKHNQMASGDRVYMEADGKVEFLAVTSGPSGSGPYTYTVTRNLDGTGANDWYAGDAVFNTGTTGDGFIDLYSVSAVNGPTVFGPTIAGMVRTGTTYSDLDTRWAIGNLNGRYGYSADTYGAAFGDNANAWVKIDPTNGVRIGENATTYVQVDPSGNATFAGQVTVGLGGRNQLTNSEFLRGPDTGRATYLSGVDGTAWGAFIDETTSLTWSTACNTGAGDYTIRNGGQCALTTTGTPNNGEYFRAWGPQLPVTAGQRIEFSYYALPYRARIEPRVIFFDASGVYVSESSGSVATSGVLGPTSTTTTQNRDLANWTRVWGISDVPSTAVLAVPVIMGTWQTGDGANPTIYYTRMYFGLAQPGQVSPSPWSPGGVSLIDGDHLSTDLVISNTIRSSGATALTTGTGYWLDATGTPTFRVGNPSGNQLKWDGTNLTIGQGVVTLDSTGIEITPDTTTGNYVPGNAYRFDVTSGRQLGMSGHVQSAEIHSLNLYATTDSTHSSAGGQISILATTPSSTSGTNTAQITAVSNRSQGEVTLVANKNGTSFGGEIRLYGIPDFRGATSGSAGSSAGYINVLVGGTSYRLQIFNP